MKKLIALFVIATLFACNSENKPKTTAENSEVSNEKAFEEVVEEIPSTFIPEFLSDISALEKVTAANPIVYFQEIADQQATNKMSITKDNIKDILSSAKAYKHFVIVTGDHTIVKITDLENSKPSGAWGASMPYAKGYIKKGDLIAKEDYINNIIGLPDNQVRTAYFFD